MKKLHKHWPAAIILSATVCSAATLVAASIQKEPEQISVPAAVAPPVHTVAAYVPAPVTGYALEPSPLPAWYFTPEEEEILLRVAMSEAESESTEGKAAVICVVLNRVKSPAFPNTISEVVFQKNQFSTTVTGGRYWITTPNEDCNAALELVRYGWDETEGALFFESNHGNSWHSKNLEYIFSLGNHRFYR